MKKLARRGGRRNRMTDAGALCPVCRSHDIRFAGRSPIGSDRRPHFRCGQCESTWTKGTAGRPYSDFVEVQDWYRPDMLEECTPERLEELGLAGSK